MISDDQLRNFESQLDSFSARTLDRISGGKTVGMTPEDRDKWVSEKIERCLSRFPVGSNEMIDKLRLMHWTYLTDEEFDRRLAAIPVGVSRVIDEFRLARQSR